MSGNIITEVFIHVALPSTSYMFIHLPPELGAPAAEKTAEQMVC